MNLGNSWLNRIGNAALDLLYPPGLYCISCGKITDDSRTYGLCNECMETANWNTGRHCDKCGKPLAENDPGPLCFSCRDTESSSHPHAFDKGHACAGYGSVEQAVIFALKYGSRSDIGDTLAEILYDRMLTEYEPDELAGMYDMVVPVPIYKDKKKKRGFNHADIMAEGFARRAGLRYEPGLIVRIRATKPMKGLGPEERRANISGAFDICPHKLGRLSGARILLIDDIFTTGATIDEIATLLKHPLGNDDNDYLDDMDIMKRYNSYRQENNDSFHYKYDRNTAVYNGRFGNTLRYNHIAASHDELARIINDSSAAAHDGRLRNTETYVARHAARTAGAARVDFLAYAAAADYLII